MDKSGDRFTFGLLFRYVVFYCLALKLPKLDVGIPFLSCRPACVGMAVSGPLKQKDAR